MYAGGGGEGTRNYIYQQIKYICIREGPGNLFKENA